MTSMFDEHCRVNEELRVRVISGLISLPGNAMFVDEVEN